MAVSELFDVIRMTVLIARRPQQLLWKVAQAKGSALINEQKLAIHGVPGREAHGSQRNSGLVCDRSRRVIQRRQNAADGY